MPRPIISEEVVLYFEEAFPDRLPRPSRDNELPTDAEVARLVGQQDVVRKIRTLYNSSMYGST